MDRKIMKENIEDNRKRSSLSGSIVVRWKWDREKKYRDFLGLRYGGSTETRYDIDLKYDENPFEKESVLIYLDQLSNDFPETKKTKIKKLLLSEDWLWNPDQAIDFDQKINRLIGDL